MVVGMQADNDDAPRPGQTTMEAREHRRRGRTRRREDEKDRVLGTGSD
jgi:hypothetical protein